MCQRQTCNWPIDTLGMLVVLGNVVAGVLGPNMFLHMACGCGLLMRFVALATLAVGVNVPARLAYWCCWLLLATLLDCAACAPALGMLGVFATVVVWCRWGQCVILTSSYGVLVALATLELLGAMCLYTWPIRWCFWN